MKVAIRCDSSTEIGTGHVMRCLSLANALRDDGAHVQFLCRAHHGNLIQLILSFGFVVQVLPEISVSYPSFGDTQCPVHASWLGGDWRSDAKQCQTFISGVVDWLIVDHYSLDHRWERSMRNTCNKIMCIDDLADRAHHCDLLLDQNLGRRLDDYSKLVPSHAKLLFGPQYALLRPEFAGWRDISMKRREAPLLRHVLITMGGVDRENVTLRILNVLEKLRLDNLEKITVILGPHAPWRVEVCTMAAKIPVLTNVLIGVKNMAELMTSSDLVIGAGGTTTWERCALGVPTIQVELADNQKFINEKVNDSNAVFLCSNDNLESDLPSLLSKASDPSCMRELSIKSANITDGLGVERTTRIMNGR